LSRSGCTRSARSRRRRSLFDCLVDRFGKPLRRFNVLAPLDARLSGSQRNVIVSRTRAQVCYVLDSWQLRHYASDFLARQRAVCRLLRFSGAGARSTRARRGQLQ
jgi:hypothetical protein